MLWPENCIAVLCGDESAANGLERRDILKPSLAS